MADKDKNATTTPPAAEKPIGAASKTGAGDKEGVTTSGSAGVTSPPKPPQHAIQQGDTKPAAGSGGASQAGARGAPQPAAPFTMPPQQGTEAPKLGAAATRTAAQQGDTVPDLPDQPVRKGRPDPNKDLIILVTKSPESSGVRFYVNGREIVLPLNVPTKMNPDYLDALGELEGVEFEVVDE